MPHAAGCSGAPPFPTNRERETLPLVAALLSLGLGVVALIVFVLVLRSVLSPIEAQLRRIANELEARNTLDADDSLSARR